MVTSSRSSVGPRPTSRSWSAGDSSTWKSLGTSPPVAAEDLRGVVDLAGQCGGDLDGLDRAAEGAGERAGDRAARAGARSAAVRPPGPPPRSPRSGRVGPVGPLGSARYRRVRRTHVPGSRKRAGFHVSPIVSGCPARFGGPCGGGIACARFTREWRNRQTRTVQVRVPERTWGFNSPLAHHSPRSLTWGFVFGASLADGSCAEVCAKPRRRRQTQCADSNGTAASSTTAEVANAYEAWTWQERRCSARVRSSGHGSSRDRVRLRVPSPRAGTRRPRARLLGGGPDSRRLGGHQTRVLPLCVGLCVGLARPRPADSSGGRKELCELL